MARSIRQPRFALDEEVILYSSGGFKYPMTSGWKLGHHYLTNKRLLFFQPSGTVYEVSLDHIVGVTLEKQRYVLGKTKEVISIKSQKGVATWIVMNDLENWRRKLCEKVLIDEETINKVAKGLDLSCSEILWYLWEHRHASIEELSQLVNAANHMDVLLRIKNIINPAAERIIGSPILSFEKSRLDAETGENVLFSWWLLGRPCQERKEEALVDIFDEGDHLSIVLELLGVRQEDIRLRVEGRKLVVSTDTGGEYRREVPLPAAVDTEGGSMKLNNNILEVRLEKRG